MKAKDIHQDHLGQMLTEAAHAATSPFQGFCDLHQMDGDVVDLKSGMALIAGKKLVNLGERHVLKTAAIRVTAVSGLSAK